MVEFDPMPATLIYQAIPPLPIARPQGATIEDTEIVVTFATTAPVVAAAWRYRPPLQADDQSKSRQTPQERQRRHRPSRGKQNREK